MNRFEVCEPQCFEPNTSIASTSNPNSSATPSETDLEVLFVDSFDSIENEAHSLQDGKRCGLIQFSGPIIIHELLLIPLFETAIIRTGSLTLGATIPPEFDITFYVNDLKAEEASTFLDIGTLSYHQTERYLFKPSCLVPTDGLFFRGNFENVTLSVHGTRVSVLPDEIETKTEHLASNANCDIYRHENDKQRTARYHDDLPEDDLYYIPRDDPPVRDDERHHHSSSQQPAQQHSSHYKYSRTPPPVTSIKSPSPAHSVKSSSSSSNNHRSSSQNLPKSFSRYIRDDDARGGSSEHSSHRNDRYHSSSSSHQVSSRRTPSPASYSYRHHNHHRHSGSNRDSSVDSFDQGRRSKRPYFRGRTSSRGSNRSNRSRSSSKSSHNSLNRPLTLRPLNSPKQNYTNSSINENFTSRAFSPLSNASSISKISLKSLESVHENGSTHGTPNRNRETSSLRSVSPQKPPTPVKAFQKELFETLSSSDDFSDLETEVPEKKVKEEVQSFEKISWSSDDELMNNEVETIEEVYPVESVESSNTNDKKNRLEEISSDEEIPNDESNDFELTDLHDNDIDDSLDIRKSVFDPLKSNQLSEVLFPLNTFGNGLNLDGKQLSAISENVVNRFGEYYHGDNRTEPVFDENWIKDVEQLSVDIMKLTLPLGDKTRADCVLTVEFKDLIHILVSIAKDSLNFDLAQKQKQGFKVRHLKAGIKLFISLFYSLEMKTIVLNELLNSDLAYHLIELYDKPFMTLSMRLLLLNALNVACDHSEFIEYVITKQFLWTNPQSASTQTPQTLYQHVLELVILLKGTARLSNSFEEFFTKVHLFEFLQKMSQNHDDGNSDVCDVEDKLRLIEKVFVRFSNQIHRPLRLFSEIPQFDVKSSVHASAPLLLLSMIELDSKHDQFNICKNRLSCLYSSCPASKIGYFAQKAIYRYLKRWNILQVIADTLERLPEHHDAKNIINLMDLFSSHHQGRCFLLQDSNNVQLTNRIHTLLMSRNVPMGTKFITRLFTFQTVDSIFQEIYSYPTLNSNSAFTGLECQVMSHLFELDCMIHLDNGALRESVLEILTSDHNFDGILAFLLPFTPGNPILDIQMSAFIYASRIASFCLQNLPERNMFHFLDSYGVVLMKCFENMQTLKKNESSFHWFKFGKFQVHFNSFLILEKWFSPFKNLNTSDSKEELCTNLILTILKKYGKVFQEKFTTQEDSVYRVFEFEPELLIALKMMLALCDPSVDHGKNQDPGLQPCYKYNIFKFYSSNCLSYMLTILDGLCETFSRPSHLPFIWNTFGECHSKGTIVQELVRVCVRSISIILNLVSTSVSEKFQDPTPIEPLLKVYHFMRFYKAAYNSDSLIFKTAQTVQTKVIQTLRQVYCQVFVTQTDSVVSIKNSLWNKFIKIAFDFILKKPQNIVSTLQIIVQLLPDCDPPQITELEFSYRKVWAVHFHVLSQEMENLCSTLLLTDCHQAQTALRQFFAKLCSLYSPSVIIVCKILCENILINLNILMKARKDLLPINCSLSSLSKIIAVVCDLFQQNIPFRIGILSSLYHLGTAEVGRKTTVKIYPVLTRMFEYFDKIKLEANVECDSITLLRHIFSTTDDKENSLEELFEQYFEENKKLIFEKDNFNLSEKALEKYRKSSNDALNDFFEKISNNSTSTDSKGDNKAEENMDNNSIYSPEFVDIYRSMTLNSDRKPSTDNVQEIVDSRLNVNFTEMSKLYLNIDNLTLNKTFETLFSTVVQISDPNEKAQSEEKIIDANLSLKRGQNRLPRRANFSRSDHFRNRVPNTSRPPSMHVDDYEAHNTSGGIKRVSHHAALLQNNSAPYAKQHPDAFLRKKPLYTLTSVSGGAYK